METPGHAFTQPRQKNEVGQLRTENRLLRHELQEQRTYFQRHIADLKAMLARAAYQVKDLLTN